MIITLKSVPGQRVYKLDNAYADIFLTSEGEFQYDIFKDLDSFRERDPFDGGACTGNMEDATEVGLEHLRELVDSMEAA